MSVLVSILRKLNVVPVPLLDTQSHLVRARAVLEANQLGVFHALQAAGGGLSVEAVAERVGISEEGASVLLTALVAIGYLEQQDGTFRNGSRVRRWILDDQRGLSNFLKLQLHTWLRFENLSETLRAGRPTLDYHQLGASVPSEVQEVYTRAMREVAQLILPAFIKRVALPAGAKRLLDIGGAHGDYARALARRFPGLQATVLDLAGPIATAQQILESEGNAEGIELRVGDALTGDLGSGWDAALLANVVHVFTPEQNRSLFTRLHAALKPGGVLLVMDQFLGVSRRRDKLAGLLSLNFFSIGGRCYAVGEMKRFLRQAGFERLKLKPFPPWQPASLIEAWK